MLDLGQYPIRMIKSNSIVQKAINIRLVRGAAGWVQSNLTSQQERKWKSKSCAILNCSYFIVPKQLFLFNSCVLDKRCAIHAVVVVYTVGGGFFCRGIIIRHQTRSRDPQINN